VARLRPHLPPPNGDDPLLALAEDLAHRFIRRRKAGLRRAAELLGDARYREPLLALLEDLAREDPVEGVRQMARQVLDAQAAAAPDDAIRGGASRHVFGIRCPNGHVTYFDKRRVCPDCGTLVRRVVRRGGLALDELALECEECGCEMVVTVDCEGYK
jgi:predicted enzyme related to lactoylglutathione lyase